MIHFIVSALSSANPDALSPFPAAHRGAATKCYVRAFLGSEASGPRLSDVSACSVAAWRQVEDVDEAGVLVDGVVEMTDLAGAAVRVGGADQLPDSVVGVVADQENGLVAFEDFAGLDAVGAQQPVP